MTKHCKECGVELEEPAPKFWLHALLGFLTCGLWIIGWVILAILEDAIPDNMCISCKYK